MRRWLTPLVVVFAGLIATEVQAQFYNRPSNNPMLNVLDRPTVSPYLNLVNPNPGNFDMGVARYQTLVRPQLDTMQRMASTQRQLRGLQDQVRRVEQFQSTALQQAPMAANQQVFGTGHPSVFMYYSHYYRIGR